MPKRIFLKYLFISLIFLLLNLLIERTFNLDLNLLKQQILSFGILSPLIYSFLIYLALTIPFIPLSEYLLLILASLTFPPHIAIIATLTANGFALSTNYYFAKYFGWPILQKVSQKNELEQLQKLTQKITIKTIFTLRWIPSLTALGIDIVSYAAALANIPFLKFFIASIIPWASLVTLFFYSTYVLKDINIALYLIPIITLATLPLFIIYFIRKKIF